MMKRAALLMATECKTPRFDSLALRGHLPFGNGDGAGFNDYSLQDAWRLRLLLDAPKGIDNATACFIAREATWPLRNLPFYHTEGVQLYAGAFEVGGKLVAVSGRLCDIAEQADPVNGLWPDYPPGGSLILLNATAAAQKVQKALCDLGLPQSEWLVGVPEDLTGFPAWFVEIELARRDLLENWNKG